MTNFNPKKELSRIKETQFYLRPQLLISLENAKIFPGNERFVGDAKTYKEYWVNSFGDRFFDMGTLIRLGGCIENLFKYYYMDKTGLTSLSDLIIDIGKNRLTIFQRILPNQNDSLQDLYMNKFNIDITKFLEFPVMQEIIANRHLYAHAMGIVSEKYVNDIKNICGRDVSLDPNLKDYLIQDVYWFEPLRKESLTEFINKTDSFFRNLS